MTPNIDQDRPGILDSEGEKKGGGVAGAGHVSRLEGKKKVNYSWFVLYFSVHFFLPLSRSSSAQRSFVFTVRWVRCSEEFQKIILLHFFTPLFHFCACRYYSVLWVIQECGDGILCFLFFPSLFCNTWLSEVHMFFLFSCFDLEEFYSSINLSSSTMKLQKNMAFQFSCFPNLFTFTITWVIACLSFLLAIQV